MVNDSTRVGITVLIELFKSNDLVPTTYFTKEFNIPNGNIRHVIRQLGAAGFIRSFPGVYGGVELAIDLADITVLDVMKALQGKMTCKLRLQWPKLAQVCKAACDAFNASLESVKIIELIEP